MWMLGLPRVKPSPKQQPTPPPGQLQLASSMATVFPLPAAMRKGTTQFRVSGVGIRSQEAVVLPKKMPMGSISRWSSSVRFMGFPPYVDWCFFKSRSAANRSLHDRSSAWSYPRR